MTTFSSTLLRTNRHERQYQSGIATILIFFASLLVWQSSHAAEPPTEPPKDWGPISSTFEEVPYPYPVNFFDVQNHGLDLKLAYMDVAPKGKANGQTVMMFHGMNFSGVAYEPTITALAEAGFRVIFPDRIGYGRSSKPDMPYSLNTFVNNARALLKHLGVEKAAIFGHSMGGVVATRFALSYPDVTTHVVMANQIGLRDSRPGRAMPEVDAMYQSTLKGTTYQSIVRNHRVYYPEWKPDYMYWVKLQYGQTLIAEWPKLAKIRAWQRYVVSADPVVYDWQHIKTKALVIGGADDRLTRDYAGAARNVAESLQNAELILFDGVGHNPHIQAPKPYHDALIKFLRSDPNEKANQGWR